MGSDCNRPSFWIGETFYQIVSNQHAWRSVGGRDAATAQAFTLARLALADLDAPLAPDGRSKALRWHNGGWTGPGLQGAPGPRAFDAEGNYVTYLPDMEAPAPLPRVPQRLQDLPGAPAAGWYVQALGDPAMQGTSALTGQDARLFVGDRSAVRLRFGK